MKLVKKFFDQDDPSVAVEGVCRPSVAKQSKIGFSRQQVVTKRDDVSQLLLCGFVCCPNGNRYLM